MATSPISATSPSTVTNPGALLNQNDFLKILLTQLTYQDPLKPMDNQQFVAQLAQFTTLEQTKQLNDQITQLLTIQSSSQSVGLIGKTVSVTTQTGEVVGQVTTVNFVNGQPQLTLQIANGGVLTSITPSQVSLVR